MTKLLKNATIGLSAIASLTLAQPSYAADTAAASATSAAVGAAAAAVRSEARPARPTKYCINVMPDTGSRVARKTCKTKAEWSEQGIDVGSKN